MAEVVAAAFTGVAVAEDFTEAVEARAATDHLEAVVVGGAADRLEADAAADSEARVEDRLAAREVGRLEDLAEGREVDRLARGAEAAAWVRHRAHADLAAGQRTGDLGAARAARRVRVLRSLMVNGIRSVGAAEIPRAEVSAGRGREQDRVRAEDFRASEIRREAERIPR
ncbi:MAG: hypothetical protein WB559_02410 [Candidatus Acidiferrales bacterium]